MLLIFREENSFVWQKVNSLYKDLSGNGVWNLDSDDSAFFRRGKYLARASQGQRPFAHVCQTESVAFFSFVRLRVLDIESPPVVLNF